ncbi:hypothetical protein [Pseudonocardia acidicola]|uniref:hypothetical protein n=1 Tax=Pseudonocardia acidicola TaxID=2724939 RepID=UPI00146CBD81|nr:hypothetical protein [Pseudonocardia acidicola]
MTTPAAAAGPPAESMHGSRLWPVLAGPMLGTFVSSLDQTIVAAAMPTIVSDLGGVNGLSRSNGAPRPPG